MPPLQEAYAEAQARWRELQEPAAPVFRVGAATCGRAAGAEAVSARLREELAGKGIDAKVIEVGCLGACFLEPLVSVHKPGVGEVCYGGIGPDEIAAIIDRFILGDDPCAEWAIGRISDNGPASIAPLSEHPFFRAQVRNVLRNCGLIDPENVHHYLARGGYEGFSRAIAQGPEATLATVKASGLCGRGGAGFPTWRKWDFCRAATGETKYLICNADEGDPGAFMNRSLLEGDPHVVLEGMLIAALAIGASQGYVYCRAEYPLAVRRVQLAIGQMRQLGLLGENILGGGLSFDIEIKMGAGAFVCGEETALIAAIEGRRGMPRPRPPFPAVSGLWGMPTVIQNVETLGNAPGILRDGPEQFAARGTGANAGAKTFALAGKINHTGLIETPLGMSLKEIVYDIGGGVPDGKALKAVQTGGPSGGCIPAEMMDLPVEYKSLAEAGSIMGSGGMIVLDEDTCMVDIARYFLSFTQAESCGKCPPCRVGTRVMLEALERICAGEAAPGDLDRLASMAQTVKKGSLCGLGQTAPNPVLTTMRYFADEYAEHIDKGQCRAFVCEKLIDYWIDADRCIGCGACLKACPADAVSGETKATHKIDQDACIHCGACLAACPAVAAAVYRTSGELTRRETPAKRAD